MNYLLILFFIGIAIAVSAQEPEPFEPQWRGAIMMAYSHIPQASQGEKTIAIIPTWGFDTEYLFHKYWGIGLQADVKLQNFKVEDANQVTLDRNFPFSLTVIAHYRTLKQWSFFVGPGVEIEESKNLFLVKIGVEYSFEISEQLDIGVGIVYENRQELYDGWTFGVSFNKLLWKRY